MSASLPIIDQLRRAGCHPARRDMVLRMPLLLLASYVDEITRLLRAENDPVGLSYVEAEYAALSSVRDRTGLILAQKASDRARLALIEAMEGGPDDKEGQAG